MFEGIDQFFRDYPTVEFVLRIVLSVLCGWCIGLERTKRSKEAGVRTYCIIACASAAIMIVSQFGFSGTILDDGSFVAGIRGVDAARLAAQVISGVSFLGAGVIFASVRLKDDIPYTEVVAFMDANKGVKSLSV